MKKNILSSAMLLLLFGGLRSNAQLSNKYKICAKYGTYNDCQQLDRTNEIECENNLHGVDCLINVDMGRSSFGSVTAEEELIANQFLNNVVVLGEFRSDEAILDDSAFEIVVLVNSSYTGGFSSLNGAHYCHPGFKYDEQVSDLLLKEFELELFKSTSINICDAETSSSTIVEKHVKRLSEFFGPSCRPGPYTEDLQLNEQLRDNYQSLCELCANGCSTFTNDVFTSSLVCLTEKNGGVAISTLKTVQKYFNSTENTEKVQNYRYLCRNGTVSTLDNPCVWSKQPWDLLIANFDQQDKISPELKIWLRSKSTLPQAIPMDSESPLSSTAEESLVGILMPEDRKYKKIHFLDSPVNLTTYLRAFRNVSSAENSVQCNTTVNWCTVSTAEQQKCLWLAQAGANRGIQPIVNCSQTEDKLSCLREINDGNVDLVDIDTNYGYLARRNGLSALAYAETITRNLTMILIVVKNNTTVTSVQDLQGKSACFPEYAGIEWLAFVNKIGSSGDACNLESVIRNFVGDSCFPGAHQRDHSSSSNEYDNILCGLCQADPEISSTATTCNADSSNLFFGNAGALRCLKAAGYYAVITKNDYNVNPDEFRVLCSNGSLASYTGFDVDQNCALTTVINNEVVVKNTNSKYNDISVAIFEFEKWFGQDRRKPFELFNRFNSTWDLLFKDSTPGLDSASTQNEFVINYRNQVSQVCSTSSTSVTTSLSLVVLIFSILFSRLNS